ncbi:MFS transporter [soil metagenome]
MIDQTPERSETKLQRGRVSVRPADAVPRLSTRFIWLYALAWGGGVIAYAPFLTLVLPLRVEALAPRDKVALLSAIALIGAVTASAVNILVGMLSDRGVQGPRGRRLWIGLGLAATLVCYAVIPFCGAKTALFGGVILLQIALNILLAPLGTLAADEVPDGQKGVVSAAMGAGGAVGMLAGVLVTAAPRLGLVGQLAIIAGLMIVCILPFLLLERRRGPLIVFPEQSPSAALRRRQDLVRVWIARLLIQICGGVLFAYLVYYLQTVDRSGLSVGPSDIAGQAAWLSGSVSIALVPLAVIVGRLSDRAGTRRPFLIATAAMVALGLVMMAVTPRWAPAFAAYALFSCGVGLFLTLQNAYAMQLLANPGHRGRDMGVLNLTNTLPTVAATGLAWILARGGDFTLVMWVLAGLAVLAAGLMAFVRDASPG